MGIKVEPIQLQIRELIEGIIAGEIGLPAFQREYVWKPDDEILLIDSVFNRYSISSMLFLEDAPNELGTKKFEGLEELITSTERSGILILDGQQRSKALVDIFYKGKIDEVCYEYLIRLFGKDGILKSILKKASRERRKINRPFVEYFFDNLEPEEFISYLAWDKPPEFGKKGLRKGERKINKEDDKDCFVELKTLVIEEERKKIENKWLVLEDKEELTETEESLVDFVTSEIRERLLFYNVPVIKLRALGTEKVDIGVLTSSFNRVNRAGLRLGPFDIAVAYFFERGTEETLRDYWKETKESFDILTEFDVDPWIILQVATIKKRNEISSSEIKSNRRTLKEKDVFAVLKTVNFSKEDWEESAKAIAETLKFLKDNLGIKYKKLLPPKYIYMVIAGFWPEKEKEGKRVTLTSFKKFFTKWYWATVLDPTRTPRGPEWSVAENDDLTIVVVGNRIKTKNIKELRAFGEELLDSVKSNLDNSREELEAIILNRAEKCLNNKKWSQIKKFDHHHAFPSSYLENLDYRTAEIENALNIIPVESTFNKTLSNNNPREWLAICLDRFFGGNKNELNKILAQHILPDYDNEIWTDYPRFVEWRSKQFLELITDLLKI